DGLVHIARLVVGIEALRRAFGQAQQRAEADADAIRARARQKERHVLAVAPAAARPMLAILRTVRMIVIIDGILVAIARGRRDRRTLRAVFSRQQRDVIGFAPEQRLVEAVRVLLAP